MDASDPRPETPTLSQRELRNESGRVLREVGEGRSFVVTNGGRPVGRLVPVDDPVPSLQVVRPARRRGRWKALGIERRAGIDLPALIDDLRGDRA